MRKSDALANNRHPRFRAFICGKNGAAYRPVFTVIKFWCCLMKSCQCRKADLARERDRHLTKARAIQMPKYGQIRTECRLFRVPFCRHQTFPSWPELVEAWLAPTSVNNHRNVQVPIPLNQWIALAMLRATGP